MPKTKSSPRTKTTHKAAPSTVHTTVTRTSAARTKNYKNVLQGDLKVGPLFAELVGSFGLVALLLTTNGNAIVAGITILFFTMAFGRLSGGHVNPAVTVALLATRKISAVRAAGYIVAQLLGAMLALVIITQFTHGAASVQDPYTGQMTQPKVFAVTALAGDWRPFFAEALGAVILGLGVAAAKFKKRGDLEAGYLIGGALILGMLLATQGSTAVLNPAAALGLDGYKLENMWTITVYAIAPLLGVAAGAWLYKLLQWDEKGEVEEA